MPLLSCLPRFIARFIAHKMKYIPEYINYGVFFQGCVTDPFLVPPFLPYFKSSTASGGT
jgi:hypothetical protein